MKTNEELIKEFCAIWQYMEPVHKDMISGFIQEALEAKDKECEERVREEYEKGRRDGMAEIAIKTNYGQTGYEVYFATWCKDKEEADAMKEKFQDFTGLLTPTKTDKTVQAFDRARELKDKLDNLSAKHYDEMFTKTDKQV